MPLVDLLERGYFPKELPNPFNTTSFAEVVTNSKIPLSAGFRVDIENTKKRPKVSQLVKYSHARVGLLRRMLSIPNPILQFLLAKEIDNNWNTLQHSIGGTPLAATSPVFASSGRAISGVKSLSEKPGLSLQARLNNRYILRTDISRFYHSIYTHSIPWALHSKSVAKANRSTKLLGNRLDVLVRSAQDGQTVGIPIGPDTSLVLEEIIMQQCDIALLQQLGNPSGHRFIDDYEIGFRTRTEAEDAFHYLERILTDYELALNPKKTEVVALPTHLVEPWVDALRAHAIRKKGANQENDLISFFDLAARLFKNYPSESIFQFAVSKLKSLEVDSENWELFQILLINSATVEPGCLPRVLQNLIPRVNSGSILLTAETSALLNALVQEHAPLAHSSEVAWSLWACLVFGITVDERSVEALNESDDSVVALLALDCQARGLVSAPLDTNKWEGYMTRKALYEDHWLLAYEANVKGWLPSKGTGDHVASDTNFGFLKAQNVEFYDLASTASPPVGIPIPIPSLPSVSSISVASA